MVKVRGYSKTVAALLGSVGTWGVTAWEDGGASAGEWFGLVAALAAVFAVWAIPNTTSASAVTSASVEDE